MAWGAVGLVVVIVAVAGHRQGQLGGRLDQHSYTPVTPAPASVVQDVTNIPASVYNTVGVDLVAVTVTPPTVLHGQPPLTLDGKTPSMLYYGAEYCPYCAAERWAMTAALSRFGTWSEPRDHRLVAHRRRPAAPTPSATTGPPLTSPYITFHAVEQYTNVPASAGTAPTPPSRTRPRRRRRSSAPVNSPTLHPQRAAPGQISFPFVDINNVALISGCELRPGHPGRAQSGPRSPAGSPTRPTRRPRPSWPRPTTSRAAICASTKDAPGVGLHELGRQGRGQGPQAELIRDRRGGPPCPPCDGNPSTTLLLSLSGLGVSTYLTITHFDKAGPGLLERRRPSTARRSPPAPSR